MSQFAFRFSISVAFLFALLSQAPGQDKPPGDAKGKAPPAPGLAPGEDYREFFKKPETPIEYWEALHFEIEVGKFDLAAGLLKGLLAKKPSDKDLLYMKDQKIGEHHGLTAILRLRNIKWSTDPATQEEAKKNVEQLITLVTEAIRKSLPGPELIAKYARNLAATEEERDFALREIYRTGPAAIPELIKALQETTGREHAKILSALPLLNADTVPPLTAALDGVKPDLRIELMDVLERRRAAGAAPFLWHLHGSVEQPDAVRRKATEALSFLLGMPAGNLPITKVALTREASRYYDHQVKFADPRQVIIWRWDARQNKLVGLDAAPVTESQAEEYYGLLFAGQALEIDPTYLPAQIVYLSLVLDKSVEQSGIDKPLAQNVNRLLVTVNPDLVNAVLDRALSDGRVRVIVAAARALGELAEARALRPIGGEQPALVRALNYPNRRVQMAAADALMRIPQSAPIGARGWWRCCAGRSPSRTAGCRKSWSASPTATCPTPSATALRKAGYEPVQVYSGRQAMLRLNEAADVDAAVDLLRAARPRPAVPAGSAARRHQRGPRAVAPGRPERDRGKRAPRPRPHRPGIAAPGTQAGDLRRERDAPGAGGGDGVAGTGGVLAAGPGADRGGAARSAGGQGRGPPPATGAGRRGPAPGARGPRPEPAPGTPAPGPRAGAGTSGAGAGTAPGARPHRLGPYRRLPGA